MSPWEVLGIPPGSDAGAIRQAYARLSRLHHPEEQPEKWQEISRAYRAALDLARGQQPPPEAAPVARPAPRPEAEAAEAEAAEAEAGWFAAVPLPSPTAPYQPPSEDALFALAKAGRLLRSDLWDSRGVWQDFLQQAQELGVTGDRYFLAELAALLAGRAVALPPRTQALIVEFFDLDSHSNMDEEDKYTPLYRVMHNARAGRKAFRRQRRRERSHFRLTVLILLGAGILIAPVALLAIVGATTALAFAPWLAVLVPLALLARWWVARRLK